MDTKRPICEKCNERPCERGGNGRHWRRVCSGCRRPGHSQNRREERGRSDYYVSKYGITQEQYDAQYAAQQGCCLICEEFRFNRGHNRLVVDHDHETGVVRGLLCRSCNIALGLFKDNPSRMKAAISYLSDSFVVSGTLT